MAKYCGKCGSKLDEVTGLCPNCDAEKIKQQAKKPAEPPKTDEKKLEISQQKAAPMSKKEARAKRKADKKAAKKERKAQKKAAKKEKKSKLSTGQKVRRFFVKLLLQLILLVVIAGGTIGGLSYMGIIDIPFLSDFNKDNILETLNERALVVAEADIVMETDDKGTATINVQIPDYEVLLKEAYASDNPDQYLVKALALGQYEVREYEEIATVTVDDGMTIIHSDEVVKQVLEEALINAINVLSEVE